MPNNFKFGDKVRLIANPVVEAEVTMEGRAFSGRLKGSNSTNTFFETEWERIPPPPFSASDLRVGDVVEFGSNNNNTSIGTVLSPPAWEHQTLFRVWRLDAETGDYKLIYKKED
jgi:hypothetical protein